MCVSAAKMNDYLPERNIIPLRSIFLPLKFPIYNLKHSNSTFSLVSLCRILLTKDINPCSSVRCIFIIDAVPVSISLIQVSAVWKLHFLHAVATFFFPQQINYGECKGIIGHINDSSITLIFVGRMLSALSTWLILTAVSHSQPSQFVAEVTRDKLFYISLSLSRYRSRSRSLSCNPNANEQQKKQFYF